MLTISYRQQHDVAQQALVESTLLGHLMNGLRAAAAWQPSADGCVRKLATMRFVAQSFRRHLERLMNVEETDGYMNIVLDAKPFLAGQVEALKCDHETFRRDAARIVHRLREAAPAEADELERISADLLAFLDRLETHNRREAKMFQEAFEQEEGGEG